MSDIFDIKDMTEEDIKLQYITPALTAKWDVKKITMETSPANKFTDGKVHIKGNIPSRDKGKRCDYVLWYNNGNLKNPDDPNVVSIKRFVSAAILQSGRKADVLITVKESIANGHRIYSIELDEINKASERFEGLSDAAEKSANRATKTPHVDNSSIADKTEKSSEEHK